MQRSQLFNESGAWRDVEAKRGSHLQLDVCGYSLSIAVDLGLKLLFKPVLLCTAAALLVPWVRYARPASLLKRYKLLLRAKHLMKLKWVVKSFIAGNACVPLITDIFLCCVQ